MEITQTQWNKYTNTQKAIREKAAKEMNRFIAQYGFNDRGSLIAFANQLANKYGEAAAEYACQLFEEIAAAQGVIVSAEVAEVLSYGEVAKAINGSLKQSPTGQLLASVMERVVKQAAEDTMLQNAKRHRAAFAWVPQGITCPYCLMIGAIGWQDAVNIKNGKHAEHIHGNCDCEYVIDFKGDMQISGYDPDALQDYFTDRVDNDFYSLVRLNGHTADKGRTSDFNEVRRMFYKENKERINAQKRAAYAARKAAEEGN